MMFVAPAAAIALAALIAPIVIHILVRQRAPRVPFPNLRFIQPHRLASVRRRALDDIALLVMRASILAFGTAAVAGPFALTDARRRAWDARTIRAEVSDADTRQGIVRAVAWLNRQPPGRREIVVRGAFPIGSLVGADIAAVPPNIGLRFERTATLPQARTLTALPIVHDGRLVERETTLNTDRTSVRDVRIGGAAGPAIEIEAPADQRPAADELRGILGRERMPVASAGQRARIAFGSAAATAESVSAGWIADAAARVARESGGDVDLRFGSDANQLIVSTAMPASDARAIGLVRAVARSLAPPAERGPGEPGERGEIVEIVPIADSQLRAWTRDSGPAAPPAADTIERDDRRWLWGAVLVLIGLESWVRRRRQYADAAKESPRAA